ncbi:MAG: SpoIVB peptidase S55 [Terracidiphilus sp.]
MASPARRYPKRDREGFDEKTVDLRGGPESRITVIDVRIRWKETRKCLVAAALMAAALAPWQMKPQTAPVTAAGPPPSTGGFFPLSEVHRGLMGTAWTVFQGTTPEPMQVEILGVLRDARGPGHDMILAQLKGAKPEYTGVVAGMSGSPVYIGNKLLGSLSYRIGQFSKEPIAGITPIAQMLEVRDLTIPQGTGIRDQGTEVQGAGSREKGVEGAGPGSEGAGSDTLFQAMETPLVMTGFSPEAVRLWQEKMAGTGLEMVAAGGEGGGSEASDAISKAAIASVEPGSAVSAQLVRGDVEIAATCTVTYVDPKQLLACGHPILQAGPVSLPMTTAEVVATLASPLNAFKIINTEQAIGAFTEDRDAAIRGVFGAKPKMIPVHINMPGVAGRKKLNVEVLDMPGLTPQAVMVVVYQSLLQTNASTADISYHITGTIDVEGYAASPVDVWAADGAQPQLAAALLLGEKFNKLFSNEGRQSAIREVDLNVEAMPRRLSVELESARFVSGNIVHAGDRVMVEATVRAWQGPERNVRIPFTVPARLEGETLRVLVSDAGTLDRTLDQPRMTPRQPDMATVLAQAGSQHAGDRIYVSLLLPETQAGMEGRTLTGLPITMANALEALRAGDGVMLNGESAVVTADAAAGGVLSGFQILNLRVEPGSGIN